MKKLTLALVATFGCGGGGGGGSLGTLPQVYPPVRANTPSALINDPTYKSAFEAFSFFHDTKAQPFDSTPDMSGPVSPGGSESLAQTVQNRLYTMGPTEILSLLKQLDGRTANIDTDTGSHPCLLKPPTAVAYALPGGQTFTTQLQCLTLLDSNKTGGTHYLAFGFDNALTATPDGGATTTTAASATGGNFYLVEGQTSGIGNAYRIDRTTGNVEGWMAVADSANLTTMTQAIMHLYSDKTAGTFELTLAGNGDGFCDAHLKTGNGNLFITGKQGANSTTCGSATTGCFAASDVSTNLGGASATCSTIAASSFTIATDLDSDSTNTAANVDPNMIYKYFNTQPAGIASY